jgi:hypothetical protein
MLLGHATRRSFAENIRGISLTEREDETQRGADSDVDEISLARGESLAGGAHCPRESKLSAFS